METTANIRPGSEQTLVNANAEKSARVATLLSVPDFCLSADVIRGAYDADISADGVWASIIDSVNADMDLAMTVEA